MLIEMRTYMLKPGCVQQYLATYEAEGKEVQTRILGNMIGYFYTDIGPLNQIVHMWGYADLKERARLRAELAKEQQWLGCVAKLQGFTLSQENKILVGAPFSPIK